MYTLQVRGLPEDIYKKLSMIAKEEHRSLAQQTIVLLRESLELPRNNRLRRKALLEKIERAPYRNVSHIDVVKLIRKDRER